MLQNSTPSRVLPIGIYRHFRTKAKYDMFGTAEHGQIDTVCGAAIYEPLLEVVNIQWRQDGEIVYQFPKAPAKDLGPMALYREHDLAMPWCRCVPNFDETIRYENQEVQRFALVP